MPTSRALRLAHAALPLCLFACSTPPADGVGSARAPLRAVPDTYPALGFDPKPSYLPNNVLVFTFDDGPDYNNTAKVLDALRDNDVKGAFFINTNNWSDVNADASMQALVRRMVDEGHELANHTVHHLHLPTLAAAAIDDEITGVENTVDTIFGAGAQRLSLFRAPFGEPYQDGMGYDLVAPIVAQHAVHIGWNFDTFDYNCTEGDKACVVTNFETGVKTPGHGAYGVILMHAVHSQTAAALPEIIAYARQNGFQFWTVEQAVCAKLHASSANIVDGQTGGCDVTPPPPPPPPDAGPTHMNPDASMAGTPDASMAGHPDASTAGQPDSGTNHMNADAGGDPGGAGTTSGCGCRVGGETNGGAAGLLLLAPLVLLVRRRRR